MKKLERQHISKVVNIGCIACLNLGYSDSPAEAHHINNSTMGKRASNYEVIPLCPAHHRLGGYGVAVHAGRKAWEANHGTESDLLKQTLELIK